MMDSGRRWFYWALLLIGTGVAATTTVGTGTAAARLDSAGLAPTTVVLRGSNPAAAAPFGDDGPAVTVLRGSPPAAVPPSAEPACPGGFFYEPGSGCVTPGYAYEPYDYGDYGYWPDLGSNGSSITRRRAFRRGFARGARVRPALRPGFRAATGLGLGFGRIGG